MHVDEGYWNYLHVCLVVATAFISNRQHSRAGPFLEEPSFRIFWFFVLDSSPNFVTLYWLTTSSTAAANER